MHLPTGIALDNVLEVTQAVATNSDGYVVDKPVYRKAADTGVGRRMAECESQDSVLESPRSGQSAKLATAVSQYASVASNGTREGLPTARCL